MNELRKIKVCDPACGSGAFLIAAYEMLEDVYWEVARAMRIAPMTDEADALLEAFPGYILNENLFGVDVSPQSVEITQLALWIRSARKGRTLADLSENIVCGNSLISDAAVHPYAMDWARRFPGVFNGSAGGFDVVIGNPPWERMKLQKREFFAFVPEVLAGLESRRPARDDPTVSRKANPGDLSARLARPLESARMLAKQSGMRQTIRFQPLAT